MGTSHGGPGELYVRCIACKCASEAPDTSDGCIVDEKMESSSRAIWSGKDGLPVMETPMLNQVSCAWRFKSFLLAHHHPSPAKSPTILSKIRKDV